MSANFFRINTSTGEKSELDTDVKFTPVNTERFKHQSMSSIFSQSKSPLKISSVADVHSNHLFRYPASLQQPVICACFARLCGSQDAGRHGSTICIWCFGGRSHYCKLRCSIAQSRCFIWSQSRSSFCGRRIILCLRSQATLSHSGTTASEAKKHA